MDLLSILGNLASIAGLFITVWVLYRVRNIEKAFLKQAILPSRMRVLRGYIRNLEKAIETRNRQSALQELERCQAFLEACFDYLEGHRRESFEQTAQKLEHGCRLAEEKEFWTECERALARLHGAYEHLKTLVKELEWRTKDAN